METMEVSAAQNSSWMMINSKPWIQKLASHCRLLSQQLQQSDGGSRQLQWEGETVSVENFLNSLSKKAKAEKAH